MNILQLKSLLAAHPDQGIRFILPDGKNIPPHYHITEVGHVKKDFIDCGGTLRSTSACLLQAWVADDTEHRLVAGKLVTILNLADQLIPSPDLPVEVEYEAPVISQFTIVDSEVTPEAVVLRLKNKHTDCLAKESCGLDGSSCGLEEGSGTPVENSCCSDTPSGCC